MKLDEVKRQILAVAAKTPKGFCVRWEWRRKGFLYSEYTPDRDEPPFEREEDAWVFAAELAAAFGPERICNVYVVDSETYVPVHNYATRKLLPLYPEAKKS